MSNKAKRISYIKQLKQELDYKVIKGNHLYNGLKYNPYKPAYELILQIELKCDSDNKYNDLFLEWIENGGTLRLRELCSEFKDKIDTKFKNDNKYPLPYENAVNALDSINYAIIWY